MNDIDFNNTGIQKICKKYHVKTLQVFGSVARGESGTDSDIDLLATFSEPISLLEFIGLERELSAVMGRKVDLKTPESISPISRIVF
ncbi:MAG: nucleotidyltransferase family protein [Bacteroidetes bacterium]|nr:nucleotidyltransferase family protein [Bacteroidota bacterium]